MRKAITIHLKCENSHKMRKYLINHGFQFFIYRRLENKYEPLDENHFTEKISHLKGTAELVCIYNGKDLSGKEVERLHRILEQVHKEPSFIESNVHTVNGP